MTQKTGYQKLKLEEKIKMKSLLKILLIFIALAIIVDSCKYLYKIGTAPESHHSSNPFFIASANK